MPNNSADFDFLAGRYKISNLHSLALRHYDALFFVKGQ